MQSIVFRVSNEAVVDGWLTLLRLHQDGDTFSLVRPTQLPTLDTPLVVSSAGGENDVVEIEIEFRSPGYESNAALEFGGDFRTLAPGETARLSLSAG